MRIFMTMIAILAAGSLPALADDVGIDFDAMPVGTVLVTETREDEPQRYHETYLGREGAFHVVEIGRPDGKGGVKPLTRRFFDAGGRLVRSEKKGRFQSSHTPFSCEYSTGPCETVYVYANPFRDGKRVTHRRRYVNRLDGTILTVSLARRGQDPLEIPYELGRYNLRVSSEYTNALGQIRGFRLIEIVEP